MKPFLIAEIGINHNGDLNIAKKLIDDASEANFDAVKFQTFVAKKFVSIQNKSRIEKLSQFQLSYEQFVELSQIAKKKGLIFFSTPLDIESAKFLNTIQKVFKISSGEI